MASWLFELDFDIFIALVWHSKKRYQIALRNGGPGGAWRSGPRYFTELFKKRLIDFIVF